MRAARSTTSILMRITFAVVLLGMLVLVAGCGGDPLVAEEGEMTCAECHTERDLLKADIEADPLPEKVEAESEGEG